MKRFVCVLIVLMLLSPASISEESRKELPEGFYELEVVKEAVERQIEQFRDFTPEQLEVVYLASKILHDEYFGEDTPGPSKIVDVRLPQGEYVIGELLPTGNFRFSLLDTEYDIVVLWVEKRGDRVGNYYSMTSEKPEVILHLDEGWTLRVTYTDVLISEITAL